MFKRYLFFIALLLCVGGSAYASKGGHLGTRLKHKVVNSKAVQGLQSKVEAISNGELAHKLANSKLGRTTAALILGTAIICSGCSNGDTLVTPWF